MLGSVFSPYYARARRRDAGDPADHSALNVALYHGNRRRWSMTERGRAAVSRTRDELRIGPSSVEWRGDELLFQIREITAPVPSRLKGVVRVRPEIMTATDFRLDPAGHHRWSPLAPRARVDVEMTHPAVRWSGTGYLDSNAGDEPLEARFAAWNWSRAPHGARAIVLYDVEPLVGDAQCLALHFAAGGRIDHIEPPPRAPLQATRWGLPRCTRSDPGTTAQVLRTLEDGPFYSRSLTRSTLLGESLTSVHESLSLRRFAAPWVRWLLPVRMPRAAR
jgi:carotenoid 1,2-hydratase